tara:strand:- start:255 stop:581 length:327 start_codon:yes stop_codon:yes gene_type:complete
MHYFAKIDENNVVTEVIIAEYASIIDGSHGDHEDWVQTYRDGGKRGRYAGIGMKYDKTKDVFYEEAPDTTWTLDNNGNWQPPTAYPSDGQSYSWNKSSQAWEINTSEG